MNSKKYLYLIQQIGFIERALHGELLTEEQHTEINGALNVCKHMAEHALGLQREIERQMKEEECGSDS